MNSIFFKGKSHVWLKNKRDRQVFLLLNLSLFLGAAILVASLVYMLFHLNNSDKIMHYFLPSVFMGLLFIIIYAVGFVIMLKKVENI